MCCRDFWKYLLRKDTPSNHCNGELTKVHYICFSFKLLVKRVLIAPLDWGLGHATRCIPVIQWLVNRKIDVRVAGNGPSLRLLEKEFPFIPQSELPDYSPRYPAGKGMVTAMALQLPRFLHVISAEHKAVEKIVQQNRIDLVISDNRYGCWTSLARCIFISHQSNIMMPKRFGWLGPMVRWMNERYVRKFDTCWIPDHPEGSLAGSLISFGKRGFHPDVRYIGPLSRFTPAIDRDVPHYDIVGVCSGPEPQRSIFERILRDQLQRSGKRFLLIRGVLDGEPTLNADARIVDYLTTQTMEKVLKGAGIVVARSGFSTVMDLNVLGKKAIFVPTPGQTEQEYLAEKMMNEKVAFYMRQESFDLTGALAESAKYTGFAGAEMNKNLDRLLSELFPYER